MAGTSQAMTWIGPLPCSGSVKPSVFSPDGDRRGDGITVTYSTNELARVFLFVNGRRRVIN